ncbi:dihydrolipoyl dehydrogenase [Ureibacillus chungkukjangi]|uniref:Dihydrolipoyl dehydrogenase n=1 Tax=Ureibacillus chungkukjangi TaxID=1202712 RepID=A0A318TLC6_9BACL|nr:dihydrolipoyl dehydrogenase [Ureibacillus chungkukjangi]MCM3389281.1 dihydrolipoyl dehydrogenase [Ureibacillus chungkukjangi]PYF03928.1 dihydrolipoamide dehydrogenase [Ureibacillus chungkukjangi]
MSQEYDLVILGGGTGGYVAAIRAAQLGLKTAIVEKEQLGGTCLHKGCIPSKALLRSAEVYRQTVNAKSFGVEAPEVKLNFSQVQDRKTSIVEQLHNGVKALVKKGKIDVYYGMGRILGPSIFSPMPGTISVEMAGQENEMLLPKNVIIATGSSPRNLNGINVDGQTILSSDHALELEVLPTSIIVVGGGVIGIEWASMLVDFGVKVTVIEYGERILPTEDVEVSNEMEKHLEKRGVEIVKNANILAESIELENGIKISASINGENQSFVAEKLLVAVGRIGNIDGIGLDNTEIECEGNFIKVNEVYQTKEKHIYAIGDVIGGMQLAHIASHEGIAAVEHIANGEKKQIDYTNIARCIYSYPEAASIGLTEEQARGKGINIKVGKFPFKGIGKALVYGDAEGFVKIIADKETNDLIGVHMIGPHVTDLISETALGMLLDATPWEIGQTIHPHPSLSEIIGEAALAVEGKAIHF